MVKTYLYERSLPRRFWRLVVCKEEDRLFFRGHRRNVFVVPNGVQEYPMMPSASETPGEILFVGSLSYEPNMDAIHFFSASILSEICHLYPGVCFRLVGKGPSCSLPASLNGLPYSVHVDVPDVAPYYEAASVVVAPIRLGSGTRLKVLEALGYGKAVVATPVAVEGLDLRPGVDFKSPRRLTPSRLHVLASSQTRPAERFGGGGPRSSAETISMGQYRRES